MIVIAEIVSLEAVPEIQITSTPPVSEIINASTDDGNKFLPTGIMQKTYENQKRMSKFAIPPEVTMPQVPQPLLRPSVDDILNTEHLAV